jgi:hypothetical protein
MRDLDRAMMGTGESSGEGRAKAMPTPTSLWAPYSMRPWKESFRVSVVATGLRQKAPVIEFEHRVA